MTTQPTKAPICATPFQHSGRLALLATAAAIVFVAQPASAQDVPAAAGAAEETPEIVVTGSQISRGGFVSPTPLTSIGAADLARVSAPNVADALNQLPALKATLTPSSATNFSVVAGGNFLDLRGLSYVRTLTLIDGKRYVPSTTTGAVNINLIPQALIGSADVVTGGASAAYGSDAVAGVVNLKLDQKLEGLKGTIQGGITDHNDYRNYLVSAAFGKSFGEGRGHILIGIESAENGGVARLGDRAWGQNRSTIANPAYTATNGQPLLLLVNDGRASNASYGGVINSPGLLKGIQFGPGGTTLPFTYGTSVSATQMNGGDGVSTSADNVLAPHTRRYSGYVGASYEVANDITAYANFAYGRSKFSEDQITGIDQITIKADNAYLPASIRSVMAANSIASFVMGRSLNDYGRGVLSQDAETWQAVGGIKGSFGDSWSFDASYANGRTRNTTLFEGSRITSRWNQAVDAVVNPLTGGVVCRSTLTNPTDGCVPINLFGVGSPSAQAKAWISGTSVRDWDIRQQVADLVVRGEPASTWAGPISIAFGGQWRRQSADVTSDPQSIAAIFRSGNTQPFFGRVTVKEAFLEAVVPLVKDASWAQNIDLNLAGRVTDYSTSGTVGTWKVGLNYAVNDTLRFRATRSRDIRAPSINELFAKGATLVYTITDPQLGQTYTIQGISGGNPNLKPEKSDTLTAGVVLTPGFLPGFNLSVDYYDIKLKDTINTLTAATIISRCYTDTPEVCSLITRANGVITQVALAPANFQGARVSGVDVEAAYRFGLGNGSVDLRALVNYTDKFDLIDGANAIHYAGSTEQPSLDGLGGTPHWRFNTSASYITDLYRLSLTGRYVGGGVITRTTSQLNGASISGRLYLDLSGEVSILKTETGKVAVFGAISNLLDKDPPITGISGYGTTRSLYDTIGRQFTAGLRFSF